MRSSKDKLEKDEKLVRRLAVTVLIYLALCAGILFIKEDCYVLKKEGFFYVSLAILSSVCLMLVLVFMRLYNDEREAEFRKANSGVTDSNSEKDTESPKTPNSPANPE